MTAAQAVERGGHRPDRATSPSRSIQKTYSQARSRLGRDSSLRMFRPWSAKTRRTREQRARLVADRDDDASSAIGVGGSTRAGGGGVRPARGRGTASGCPGRSPISSARTSRPNSAAARGDRTAAAPTLAAIDDGLAGARRVVGREELPRPGRAGRPRPGRAPGCASRPARCPRGAGRAGRPGRAGPGRRPRRGSSRSCSSSRS